MLLISKSASNEKSDDIYGGESRWSPKTKEFLVRLCLIFATHLWPEVYVCSKEANKTMRIDRTSKNSTKNQNIWTTEHRETKTAFDKQWRAKEPRGCSVVRELHSLLDWFIQIEPQGAW